jgi:hypothetical protein
MDTANLEANPMEAGGRQAAIAAASAGSVSAAGAGQEWTDGTLTI